MLLFSTTGTVLLSGVLQPNAGDHWSLYLTNWAGTACWIPIAMISILLTTFRTVSVLGRMGGFGLQRPRWWFEIARSCWNSSIVCVTGVLLLILLPRQVMAVFDPAFAAVRSFGIALLLSSLGFATGGDVVSFATGRCRRGRAYDCVRYFYTLVGPMFLVGFAPELCPTNFLFPGDMGQTLVMILGFVLMGMGLILNVEYSNDGE